MKKITVLFFVGALITLFIDYFRLSESVCDSYSCSLKIEGILLGWFIIFVIDLLIIFILRFLPQDCFTSWWKFARIAVPLILLITFIISLELHHSPGGWFNIDDAVDMAVQFGLYALFTIGSFIQIYRGYKKVR